MLTLQPVRGIIRVMKSRQIMHKCKFINLLIIVFFSGILTGCGSQAVVQEENVAPQTLRETESYLIPDKISLFSLSV